MVLDDIQRKIRSGAYTFSDHAVKRMIKRGILRREVEETVFQGEIIEEYPDDKYSPSCLIYGKTEDGRRKGFARSGLVAAVSSNNHSVWTRLERMD